MICNYRNEFKHPVCKLGMYGGMPSRNICNHCIEKGQNNEEYAKQLFMRVEISHPSTARRASGCCDSARNYIDR
jgi:hypothetical protein